jgi:polysaccharide deacetylase 2 family uncharacterized protein YibQ
MEVLTQDVPRKRRWRLWAGLLLLVVLAALIAGLYPRGNGLRQASSLQGASAPLPPPLPAMLAYAVTPPDAQGKPRIALVIDGLGVDGDLAARAEALKGPVTLAFLAYAGNLPRQEAEARHAGHELLLHVPPGMTGKSLASGPDGGASGPPPEESVRRLDWDLNRMQAYVGIDMPSISGADSRAAPLVMNDLKNRGLLFLDAEDNAGAGAPARDAAHDAGVPYAAGDMRIDASGDMAAQLARLEALARQNGAAIAIVSGTGPSLAALKTWLPSLAKKGIVLTPLSDIVRTRNTAS